ncbi:MAG: hypothetical protein GXY52_07045 [Chloroflexi bacterium]|nr:hypothetical protein [Chloroflexota bacterium]
MHDKWQRATAIYLIVGILAAMAGCVPVATPTPPAPEPTLAPTITPSPSVEIKVATTAAPTATPEPLILPSPAPLNPVSAAVGQIEAISFIDAKHGWLLGSACADDLATCKSRPVVLRVTTDGSEHWVPQHVPMAYTTDSLAEEIQNQPRVNNVLFITKKDGWIYGESAFYTNDGGNTWFASDQPIRSLSAKLGILWAVIGESDDAWQIATSDDGGKTWKTAANASGWKGVAPQLVVSSATQAWVLSSDADGWYLWQTNDGGASWTTLPEPDGMPTVVRILAVDPSGQLWLMSGAQPGGDLQEKTMHRSDDGGTTWEQVALTTMDQSVPCRIPWLGELRQQPGSLATNGEGQWFIALGRFTLVGSDAKACKWAESILAEDANLGDATIECVTWFDATHGWAAANPNRLFITNDGGANWQLVKVR